MKKYFNNFFSIRHKFLLSTTGLLIFCVGCYLLLATSTITKDKKNLVFELNQIVVSNTSSEIEAVLNSTVDKLELVAHFFRKQDSSSLKIIQSLLKKNSEFVFVGGSRRFQTVDRFFYKNQNYLATYQITESEMDELLDKVPFEKIKTDGEAVWKVELKGRPTLLGFGKSVIEENSHKTRVGHFGVFAFVEINSVMSQLNKDQLHRLFLVTEDGELIGHADNNQQFLLAYKKAHAIPVEQGVFEVSNSKENYLAGFSKAFKNQLMVISMIPESKAFAVVKHLYFRSILFASMIVTLAFIVAILFSRSLTRPIDQLLSGMKKVGSGDLETQIHVHTRDEIRFLAQSFNQMIGDLKQSRNELEEVNRGLEEKVKERTAQLEKQNQAVKSAQEALLQSTRLASVGEIAGRAAHEVLNPLTSILSRIQKIKSRLGRQSQQETQILEDIAQSWESDFEQGGFESLVKNWEKPSQVYSEKNIWDEDIKNLRQIIGNIKLEWKNLDSDTEFLIAESERINRIVRSMRNLSIQKSDKKVFKLSELIVDSVNVMADYASKEDVTIVTSQPDPSIRVELDRDEFLQCLTNMIRNSIQSISEKAKSSNQDFRGWIRIHISERAGEIEIVLGDNGVGIPEENKSRIFDSQFSTKDREKGTGLGLNISRRFIRGFGGDIQLGQSQPGEGATFTIRLPRHQPAERRASA